jgi:hypothetical protein
LNQLLGHEKRIVPSNIAIGPKIWSSNHINIVNSVVIVPFVWVGSPSCNNLPSNRKEQVFGIAPPTLAWDHLQIIITSYTETCFMPLKWCNFLFLMEISCFANEYLSFCSTHVEMPTSDAKHVLIKY